MFAAAICRLSSFAFGHESATQGAVRESSAAYFVGATDDDDTGQNTHESCTESDTGSRGAGDGDDKHDVDSAPDLGVADAAKVHDLLQSLHALGNEVRLALLEALVTLHEGRLYFELGYSSFHQYCDRELGYGRSTAYEYLRA
jgi:hypothetical protein